MRGIRACAVLMMVFLMTASVLVTQVGADPVPHRAQGQVDPNPGDGALAFPGTTVFYIQNRTSEGMDMDVMIQGGGVEYYDQAIEDSITDWEPGDPGVMIANVEHGTYLGGDRIGYVAYSTAPLTGVGATIFPLAELQKIPTPTMVENGTGFINITWSALPDPSSLIAGYKVYRSETNASDGDWTLWGGSVNAPLTDLWYNDTTSVVAGVTYYYSIKVCFVGIIEEPSNMGVSNYQNQYYGEGSAPMSSPGVPPTVDWIAIVDTAGIGLTNITDQMVNVWFTIQGYAAAYNTTFGYLGDISVDWSVVLGGGSNAFTGPLSGDTSTFNASTAGGTATWTAIDPVSGKQDTVSFTINPPGVDYIEIVDTPGTGLTPIAGATVDVGYTIMGYAAAFNTTIGYFMDISVTWSVLNGGGANGQTNPLSGTSSTFNASSPDGTAQWRADDGAGHIDFVDFTINPPTVDSITIVDTAGTGNNEIIDQPVGVGVTITGYAAGFNSTTGTYVMDVSVTWDVIPTGLEDANTAPLSGTTSDFYSGTIAGSVTWTADYGGGVTDTVTITINPPTVDSITIVDQPGTGTIVIPDQAVDVGVTITGYAAGFNTTLGTYVMDVSVTWSVTPAGGEDANTAPLSGTTSDFYSGTITGSVTWTADYGGGVTDTVTIDINPPTVDYILIVDAPGGTGSEITDKSIGVDTIVNCWAAGYNITSGYVIDVSVTWSVLNGGGANAVTNPLSGVNTTFDAKAAAGTATLTADDGLGHSDMINFTILIPTVDYILIVDTANTGSAEITDQDVDVGVKVPGFAAAFNDTIGYLYDVAADWTAAPAGLANSTTFPLLGSAFSDFYSGYYAGTAVWNASFGGMSDVVNFTINAPIVNYILIVDTALTGAAEILPQTVDVGVIISGFAAGFNDTIGYLNDVAADWSVGNVSSNATTSPLLGSDFSDFYSGYYGGTATWQADFGGLIDTVIIDVNPPGVDTILIVDTQGTGATEIPAQNLEVGVFVTTGYAAGFNDTTGYIGDVAVTWSVMNDATTNATTSPLLGSDTSDFYSGYYGGTATWQAEYGVGIIDTVIFTVLPPEIDYIRIVDTALTGGAIILDQTVVISTFTVGYAASFNDTIGWIGDVTADWSVVNTLGAAADTNPKVTTDTSTFDAGATEGHANWTATYLTFTDMVQFDVTPHLTDWIVIVDKPGMGITEIPDQTVGVGYLITGYAAAFNVTQGYLGDVTVTWLVTPTAGENADTNPLSGTSSAFYSGTIDGSVVWEASFWESVNGVWLTDVVNITISPAVLDYILIVDTAGTGTTEIQDQTVDVGETIPGYAASFNNSIGYLGDILVSWQVLPPGSDADTNPISGLSSDFYSGAIGDTVTWEADDLSGHIDTVIITVNPPVIDYIDIVDTAGTGTFEIMDQAVGVGATITGYAAGFNNSVGYVQDVSATWTIIQGPENATTTPSPGTLSDFWSGWIGGSVDWEADYGGLIDTVTVTINPPTVDYIRIVDTQFTGLTEISDQTVVISTTIWGFAAGFNYTVGYIDDYSVTWSIQNISGATASTTPSGGSISLFDAGADTGGAIWKADYGGGIEDTVVFSITDIIPDALVIVDGAGSGTFEILDQTTIVGESFLGFAAAFSSATYWGDVSATWTLINNVGTNANTNPGTGTSSTFYSGTLGGTVTWQASYYEPINGVWLNDTVDFTVDPPTIDYITIVDNAGTGMMEIADQTVPVGFAITGYVASFNYTSLYLGDISVGWTVDLGTASTTPASGLTSDFTAGIAGGTATWMANDPVSGKQDTVVFTISDPTVDYILIVDNPNIGSIEISDQTVDVGFAISGYAAGFNTTANYIGDVTVSWSVDLGSASTLPASGDTSDFDAGLAGGSAIWTADYGGGIDDTVTFTIRDPTVDYITIVDTQDTGITEIADQTVPVGFAITGYVASFNYTSLYLGDISVGWTVDLGTASTTPASGLTSDFTAGIAGGTATWMANDPVSGKQDTVVFTIRDPTVDYVEIVDTVDIGTTAIADQAVDVGVTITGYAAGFNTTSGYVMDVSADWSVTPSGTEDASTDAGPDTNADFRSGTIGGSVDWEADYNGMTYTVTITINPPTVDYITIVDTADIGTTEILDQTVSINIVLTGYAASFNFTSDYIGDISVSWTVTPTGSEDASTTPGSGTSSGFDSGTVDGSVTWTAEDLSGHTDTVVFTISPPTIDYVRIVDAPSETGNLVTGLVYGVSDTDTYYLIGFNDVSGYMGLVEAESWTITPATGVGTLTFTSPSSSVDFTALEVDIDTTFTVTASDTDSGESDTTGTLTVLAPIVDSIKIEDAAANAGSEVTSITMNDDTTENLYAAGYNATSGYVMDVSADWTTTLGSVAPASGAMTTYTPAAGTGIGTLTATYMGLTANVALDVSDVTGPPKPDSLTLEIVDDKVVVTFPASPPTDVAEYQVQRRNGTTGDWVNVGSRLDAGTASFTDEDVKAGKTYGYRIVAYDAAGNPSEASDPVDIKIPDKDEGLPWVWLLLLIIIIIIIILLLLFLMTRKKEEEEEMPPEEEAAPEMPEEEMPFEEEGLGVAAVAAPLPGAAAGEAAPGEHMCPNCGGAMEFIEDYDQYYCYTCGKYDSEFDEEGGEGGDEMPEGEGEPPSEEPEGEEPSDEGRSGDEHPREDEGGPESEENPPEY